MRTAAHHIRKLDGYLAALALLGYGGVIATVAGHSLGVRRMPRAQMPVMEAIRHEKGAPSHVRQRRMRQEPVGNPLPRRFLEDSSVILSRGIQPDPWR